MKTNEVRYVTGGDVDIFQRMLLSIYQRNNAGKTSADKMVHVAPVIMNSSLGLMISPLNPTNRFAWMAQCRNMPHFLVWFGNPSFEDTRCDEQNNMVPDPAKCVSSEFTNADSAFSAIEDYVLLGKLPENVIPIGHFKTLTG